MATRAVSLSVTVNLGDYENMRMEATCDTFNDAAQVIDDALREIQRNTNQSTGNKIESYRKRVLAALIARPEPPIQTYGEELRGESLAGQPMEVASKPTVVEGSGAVPVEPEPVKPKAKKAKPKKPEPPAEEDKVDAAVTTETGSGIHCNICACEVSSTQAKVSQMFVGHTLCDEHMKEATK